MAGSARIVGMQAMVMLGAKPRHFERLGIILVVAVHVLRSADLANTLLQLSIAERVTHRRLRSIRFWMLVSPLDRDRPGVSPSVWLLCSLPIIGLDCWICAGALNYASLDAFFALPAIALVKLA